MLMPWRAGVVARVKGVSIKAGRIQQGKIYPVTPAEIRRILERMPDEDLRGLKSVEFVNPKEDQKGSWAQYVRSRRTILIFSQPYDKDGKLIDGQSPQWVKNHMKDYVIPHEVGHHKALYLAGKTDGELEMAEARADANVVGLDPMDRDVRVLKSLRS